MRLKFTWNHYQVLLWIMFLFAFQASSFFVVNYENAMNHKGLTVEQMYFTGAARGGMSSNTVNLFNEGPIGYAGLTAVLVSGVLWARQTVKLPGYFSQGNSNSLLEGGEIA